MTNHDYLVRLCMSLELEARGCELAGTAGKQKDGWTEGMGILAKKFRAAVSVIESLEADNISLRSQLNAAQIKSGDLIQMSAP